MSFVGDPNANIKRDRESPEDADGLAMAGRGPTDQPPLRVGTEASAVHVEANGGATAQQWDAIDVDLDSRPAPGAAVLPSSAAAEVGGAELTTSSAPPPPPPPARRGILSLKSRLTTNTTAAGEEVGGGATSAATAPTTVAGGVAAAMTAANNGSSNAAAKVGVTEGSGKRVLSFGLNRNKNTPSATSATPAVAAEETANTATTAPTVAITGPRRISLGIRKPATPTPAAVEEETIKAPAADSNDDDNAVGVSSDKVSSSAPGAATATAFGTSRSCGGDEEVVGDDDLLLAGGGVTVGEQQQQQQQQQPSVEAIASPISRSVGGRLSLAPPPPLPPQQQPSASPQGSSGNNAADLVTTNNAGCDDDDDGVNMMAMLLDEPEEIGVEDMNKGGHVVVPPRSKATPTTATATKNGKGNPMSADTMALLEASSKASLVAAAAATLREDGDATTAGDVPPPPLAPTGPPLPGLDCYNFGAYNYSGGQNTSFIRSASAGGGGLTSPTSLAGGSRNTTPIGFTAARNAAQRGAAASMKKHSKLGFAIPPPCNDMGLAPFFHPHAFQDLNAAVANAMCSHLMASPGGSQAAGGGGGGQGSLLIRSTGLGGVLSAASPMGAGGGGGGLSGWGGVTSIGSSPAYGATGAFGPRTPTTEVGAAAPSFTSPPQYGPGGGPVMGSPVPFGMSANGVLISSSNINAADGGGGAAADGAATASASAPPALLSPRGVGGGGGGGGGAAIGGCTTAFIPLPEALQVPIFVRENRTNNANGGYFADKNGTPTSDGGNNGSGGAYPKTLNEQLLQSEDEEQRRANNGSSNGAPLPLVSEDLFATALHPFASTYDYDPRDKMGEGTYGAVYIGYTKASRARPNRTKVAIKLLKQLPNFEGFPITSVREISVHRYLRSVPEAQRNKLLVVDDVRFEYLDQSVAGGGGGSLRSSLTVEMQMELIAMNQRLPPSLQNLPAHRRGIVIGDVVVFLVSPFVEHTLTSIRQSLRVYGAGGSSTSATGASQLANAFQQGFDHHHRTSSASQQSLSPLCFNEAFILFIFIQILEGLHQLHRARIMHRDIKEDNILVTRNGDVKICDFGLAVPLEGERAKITPSLIVMFYRPPEMLLGAAQYSTAVDMWSAGCLLAQQFLGVPPFITKDGQPTNELDQLKIIADVLGPLPAKLLDLAAPEVRSIIFNHPQRDLIFEKGAWGAYAANPANLSANPNVARLQQQQHNQQHPPPMTTTDRFNRFRTWFDQMYKARRRAHMNNVALEMPTLDTLIAIFNMLSLDPATRPSAERMLKCSERTCSNRFASNASLVGAADSDRAGLSMRSMQTAQSLQQALCWSCRGRSKAAYMKEGVAKLPPPKTHLRPKQQQQFQQQQQQQQQQTVGHVNQ